MKLTRLRLENVRSVADGEYGFTHPDGRPFDIALVTGPSASGKTTVLEAIAMAKERVAPSGRPARPRDFLRAGQSHGLVELTLLLNDDERKRSGISDPVAKIRVAVSGARGETDPRLVDLLGTYSHDPAIGVVDYFPQNRALTAPFGMEPPPDVATERRLRLSRDDDKYRGIIPWLRHNLLLRAGALETELRRGGMVMSTDLVDPLADFSSTLAAMCPWLRLDGLAGDGATPMFLRSDGSSPPILELSAAEKDAVIFAATLRRIGHARSLLLVDRPDLHADPDDQTRILQTLAAPDNQLIVAASSDRLRREIPAAQHVTLVRR